MDRIRFIVVGGKKILTINYSGLKEDLMLQLAAEVKEVILQSSGHLLVLNNFENTYVTPKYMRYMEQASKEVIPFIDRNAMVGFSKVKLMILRGFNLIMGTNWLAFPTEKEALEYLIQGRIEHEMTPVF